MRSGSVGTVAYRSCLTLHVSSEGIYVSVFFLFRLWQPPLFIPWNAVYSARRKRSLLSRYVVFDVGSPRIARLGLPLEVFEGRDLPA